MNLTSANIIFLVRHAEGDKDKDNPALTSFGIKQAEFLTEKIKENLRISDYTGAVTIWSSTTDYAIQTAEIIARDIDRPCETFFITRLCGVTKSEDFVWLENKINDFSGEILIIVSNSEYVQGFASRIGFSDIYFDPSFIEGVIFENDGSIRKF